MYCLKVVSIPQPCSEWRRKRDGSGGTYCARQEFRQQRHVADVAFANVVRIAVEDKGRVFNPVVRIEVDRGPEQRQFAKDLRQARDIAEAVMTLVRGCKRAGTQCAGRASLAGLDPRQTEVVWVRIAGGRFRMGAKRKWYTADEYSEQEDAPIHTVLVSSFDMAKTETTVAQYASCVEAESCAPLGGSAQWCQKSANWTANWCRAIDKKKYLMYPIAKATWAESRAFCKWAGGRLPTEAEWEFAATNRGRTRYPWGRAPATCRVAVMAAKETAEHPDSAGCYSSSNEPDEARVCSRPAGNSRKGLCDLVGNVAEWTSDWYEWEYYKRAPRRNPRNLNSKSGEISVRGGHSWDDDQPSLTPANRMGYKPDATLGFRCVRKVQARRRR